MTGYEQSAQAERAVFAQGAAQDAAAWEGEAMERGRKYELVVYRDGTSALSQFFIGGEQETSEPEDSALTYIGREFFGEEATAALVAALHTRPPQGAKGED
jgi:hypothetical protein